MVIEHDNHLELDLLSTSQYRTPFAVDRAQVYSSPSSSVIFIELHIHIEHHYLSTSDDCARFGGVSCSNRFELDITQYIRAPSNIEPGQNRPQFLPCSVILRRGGGGGQRMFH